MLKRKNGGGHEYRDLLATHYCLKCRTKRDLGLTESNVTAKQTVHRYGLHHISLDLLNGNELRLGFLILKRCGKLVLKLTVGRKCKAGCPLPFSIKADKILGNILCRTLCARLGTAPITATHFGKLDSAVIVLFADILSYQLKAVAWNEELIRSCVFYRYIVLGYAVNRYGFNALKKTDTVVGMNHVISK